MSLIQKNNKGMIVLVNKWDLIEKENNTTIMFEKDIREKTAPFTDYPILFISAFNKQRIHNVLEVVEQVNLNRNRKITTSELNDVILHQVKNNQPPALKGKFVNIRYVTQLPIYNHAFAFFCNLPEYVKDPYKRYLENRMRAVSYTHLRAHETRHI